DPARGRPAGPVSGRRPAGLSGPTGERRAAWQWFASPSPYFLAGAMVGAETFLSDEWPLNVRVSANSPSLWPTMFSDTYTGMCCLPLWTAIVRPTNSGVIVERRDHVLIGFLSLTARGAYILFLVCFETSAPFVRECAIC